MEENSPSIMAQRRLPTVKRRFAVAPQLRPAIPAGSRPDSATHSFRVDDGTPPRANPQAWNAPVGKANARRRCELWWRSALGGGVKLPGGERFSRARGGRRCMRFRSRPTPLSMRSPVNQKPRACRGWFSPSDRCGSVGEEDPDRWDHDAATHERATRRNWRG
jgi:hypothetical protein